MKKTIEHKKEMAKMLNEINDGFSLVFDLKTFGTASFINKMNAGSVSLVIADFLKDLTKNQKEREFVAHKIAEKLGVELPKIDADVSSYIG